MNPFAALAVKTIGAGTAAALLSLGVAGSLAQAASPSPKPTPPAATTPAKPDPHKDRRAIALAVFESEADVLHITPAQLREDLRQGQKVSDLPKRVLRRGPSFFPLAAFEVGLALLLERRDPFIRVFGHEHAADRLALHRQAEVQRPTQALRDRELGVSDRNARPVGEPSRVLDRARSA